MEQWKHATTKNLDAKSANIAWKPDAIPRRSLFDFTQEDETFLSNFNQPITTEGIADNDQEGSDRVGDALDAPNYIGMEVGIRRGAEGELQRAKVPQRLTNENGNPMGIGNNNPIANTRRYKVEYADGSTETFSANMLATNILSQVDEHGHCHHMMEEIGGHRRSEDALNKDEAFYVMESGTQPQRFTTKGWEMYVIWKDGSSNYIPNSELLEKRVTGRINTNKNTLFTLTPFFLKL